MAIVTNYLRIKRVVGKTDFGGCKPVWIIADDNKEYLLKFRQDGNEKDISNFNEYVAYRLDKTLEFNVSPQEIKFIMIDESDIALFQNAPIEYDSIKFAKQSIGINIAIEKIPNVIMPSYIDVKAIRKKIANLDNFILNSDRTEDNPNILYSTQTGKYHVIDYGLALLDHRVYNALKRFDDISTYEMKLRDCNVTAGEYYILKGEAKINFAMSFQDIFDIVHKIIVECPDDWEPLQFDVEIADLIANRILNKRLFLATNKCPCELYQ